MPQQSEMQNVPKYVPVAEAARLVYLSSPTIRRFLGQGRLKRFKIGGRVLVSTSELFGLIKETK